MEHKIPGNSGISEKMDNFERLTKFFEMNVAEKTVSFYSRLRISEFLPKWIAPCKNHAATVTKTFTSLYKFELF